MNGSADQKIQAARFTRVVVHAGGAVRRSRCAGLSGVAAVAIFAAATLKASSLYLMRAPPATLTPALSLRAREGYTTNPVLRFVCRKSVVAEQTFSDPAWRAVAETLAARHGGEALTYSGIAFPETLRAALAASRPAYVCFVAQPQEVTQAFLAKAKSAAIPVHVRVVPLECKSM